MKKEFFAYSIFSGISGLLVLLAIYFSVISLVSGWSFAKAQFSQYWYFIILLAFGFGIQVGLFAYLRRSLSYRNSSGKVLAFTGATSAASMVSCCAHYLVNIVPILGIGGAVSLLAQYQVEFFWVGLFSNSLGIAFIANRIVKISHRE